MTIAKRAYRIMTLTLLLLVYMAFFAVQCFFNFEAFSTPRAYRHFCALATGRDQSSAQPAAPQTDARQTSAGQPVASRPNGRKSGCRQTSASQPGAPQPDRQVYSGNNNIAIRSAQLAGTHPVQPLAKRLLRLNKRFQQEEISPCEITSIPAPQRFLPWKSSSSYRNIFRSGVLPVTRPLRGPPFIAC